MALWCAGLERRPPPPGTPCLLATARTGDAYALAMQLGPNPVLVEHSDPAAAGEIAEALADEGRAVPGVDGAPAASEAFARAWCARTGRRSVERVRLRHHELANVRTVPMPPGRAREATEADRDWLVKAMEAFTIEAKVPRAPQGTRRYVDDRLAERRFRLWDDDGIASFLGVHGLDAPFARVGPVYTPPERRGRGAATALVAAASRELLSRGAARVYLTTDLANPVSNAIYARVGYVPVDDMVGYDFVEP